MTAPTLNTAGALLYDRMAPWATYDDANGHALAWICQALGVELNDVTEFMDVGWDESMDPDQAPEWFLPHLAMWAGVRFVPEGLTIEQKRARVRSTDGLKRGTVGAILGAARQHLTGLQRVILLERTDPGNPGDEPYHLTVYTYSLETPDPALTEAAIREQKPVGLVLHYDVIPEDGWDTAADTWDDYDIAVTWDNYTP